MRGRAVAVLGLCLGLAMSARPGVAQIAWDSPMLIGPGAPAGYGVYLFDVDPGDGIGVMGTYRTSPVPVGLGFRAGVGQEPGRGDGGGHDVAVFGGVDVSGFLTQTDTDVPIEVLWLAGGGIGIGNDVLLSFPLGLSAGVNVTSEDVVFRPYLSPRLVLDAFFGDNGTQTSSDLELNFALDMGLDIAFDPSWLIRFAATVVDRDALLIGVAFPR